MNKLLHMYTYPSHSNVIVPYTSDFTNSHAHVKLDDPSYSVRLLVHECHGTYMCTYTYMCTSCKTNYSAREHHLRLSHTCTRFDTNMLHLT